MQIVGCLKNICRAFFQPKSHKQEIINAKKSPFKMCAVYVCFYHNRLSHYWFYTNVDFYVCWLKHTDGSITPWDRCVSCDTHKYYYNHINVKYDCTIEGKIIMYFMIYFSCFKTIIYLSGEWITNCLKATVQ